MGGGVGALGAAPRREVKPTRNANILNSFILCGHVLYHQYASTITHTYNISSQQFSSSLKIIVKRAEPSHAKFTFAFAAATWASEGCTLDPSPGHGPVDRPRIGGTAGPAAQLGDGISLKKKNAEAVSNILACDLVILRFSLKDHPLTAP